MRGAIRYQLQHPNGVHCKYITRSEYSTILSKKLGVRVYSKKGQMAKCRLLPEVKPSTSKPSALSITFDDMQAFVGIGEPHQIHAARVKVKEFHPKRHGVAAEMRKKPNV